MPLHAAHLQMQSPPLALLLAPPLQRDTAWGPVYAQSCLPSTSAHGNDSARPDGPDDGAPALRLRSTQYRSSTPGGAHRAGTLQRQDASAAPDSFHESEHPSWRGAVWDPGKDP